MHQQHGFWQMSGASLTRNSSMFAVLPHRFAAADRRAAGLGGSRQEAAPAGGATALSAQICVASWCDRSMLVCVLTGAAVVTGGGVAKLI